jgi:thiamine-phosphate diphosphorylase
LDTFTIGNIGVGPIFSTQTKPNANPVGISYVYWAKQFSKFPIVAIGGGLKRQILISFGKRIPILFVPFLK